VTYDPSASDSSLPRTHDHP